MARIKVFDTKSQSWVYADKSFGKDAPQESVLYVKQTLTEAQKAQARDNIGVDAVFTAELVARVIESLGGNPVFGVLDSDNNIILSGLEDGTYILKYENEDGTYTEIGTLDVDEIPDPDAITNLVRTALDQN